MCLVFGFQQQICKPDIFNLQKRTWNLNNRPTKYRSCKGRLFRSIQDGDTQCFPLKILLVYLNTHKQKGSGPNILSKSILSQQIKKSF